ncbi:2-octaprenyl-3-methyl-6-methoxy-1,4-benzoquinol hydroxylase [Thiocystis minor]|uniref:UbiH/UbiF/VisC/COQ6 family ubiquinone biosynthesis hydroxylase n=1 Tax=Thiocystis minor TaxID=61597 RepID=UPI001913AEDB|nr:UbiH/UbiF/VisC/COQ6 family ubiquinone biosynthesis hydroxylase [Thiocystis minor]MBK5965602.1 2-octaprenyl-3-methyl-6-methoxy-1,4-benzoquinol hydroxylase [Thiocystis minor]
MTESEQSFDIAVVGGGMVGAAFSRAMSGKGLSIALIESRAPLRDWPAGEVDLRVSALSRASQRMLQRLGVWERILELGASPYRQMRVWDAASSGRIRFDSADLGEADLGHIVENRVIQLALWERLEQTPDVALICPAVIADLDRREPPARIRFADGRSIDARLLVGADGRDSLVRDLAGIATEGWNYDQRAIVANVRPADWHQETAWQRFLPTGPLALLPLSDGRCSIVWSADDERALELMNLNDGLFSEMVTDASESCLGRLILDGPRASVPLRLQHAKQYVLPGLALIGDAAHAIHPLAGQGVNLGFLDAAELAATLDLAIERRRDLAGLWTLRHYERARRGDNLLMLGAMDVFKRIFGDSRQPLAAIRGLGLTTVDRLAPLKRLFMDRALGLGADLPPLVRPYTAS